VTQIVFEYKFFMGIKQYFIRTTWLFSAATHQVPSYAT